MKSTIKSTIRNLLPALLLLLPLAASSGAFAAKGGNKGDDVAAGNHKIDICHRTSSQNNPWVLLNVSVNAAQAHYDHGDPLEFTPVGKKGCAPSTEPPVAPEVSLTVAADWIYVGATTTVTWSSTDATSCKLNDTTPLATAGTTTVGPFSSAGDVTISITCTGAGGSATASDTLEVNPLPTAPTVTLTLADSRIDVGATTTATWTSTNATSCTLGDNDTSGSAVVGPYDTAGTVSVSISCTGAGGTTTTSQSLSVVEAHPNTALVCARSPFGSTGGSAVLNVWAVAFDYSTGTLRGLTENSELLTGTVYPADGVTLENALFTDGTVLDVQYEGMSGISDGTVIVQNVGTQDAQAYYILSLTLGEVVVPADGANNLFWFEATCPELSSLPDPR